jgi:hypothetical protein
MSKVLSSGLAVVFLGCLAITLSAQSEPGTTGDAEGDSRLEAEIETLLALPGSERRTRLRSLEPAERRGLWMRLKRAEADRKGARPKASYREIEPHPASGAPDKAWLKAVGSIVYDKGFPAVGFGGGQLVGNRFNTHTGVPVLASGTISTIRAAMVRGPAFSQTTSNAGLVVLGPQTTMGGATALFSTFTTASGVVATVSFTGLGINYTGSSYFALMADNANQYVPVLGTATTLGQGHHGLVGYTGGLGITGTFNLGGNLNALVRASGNIVPVELMWFEIE